MEYNTAIGNCLPNVRIPRRHTVRIPAAWIYAGCRDRVGGVALVFFSTTMKMLKYHLKLCDVVLHLLFINLLDAVFTVTATDDVVRTNK